MMLVLRRVSHHLDQTKQYVRGGGRHQNNDFTYLHMIPYTVATRYRIGYGVVLDSVRGFSFLDFCIARLVIDLVGHGFLVLFGLSSIFLFLRLNPCRFMLLSGKTY